MIAIIANTSLVEREKLTPRPVIPKSGGKPGNEASDTDLLSYSPSLYHDDEMAIIGTTRGLAIIGESTLGKDSLYKVCTKNTHTCRQVGICYIKCKLYIPSTKI